MFNRKSTDTREDLIPQTYGLFLALFVFISAVIYIAYTCFKKPKTIAEKIREKLAKQKSLDVVKLKRKIKALSSSAQTMAALTANSADEKNSDDSQSSTQQSSPASSSSNRNPPSPPAEKRKVVPPRERQSTLAIQAKIRDRQAEKLAEERMAQKAADKEKQDRELAAAKWRVEMAAKKAQRKLAAEAAAKEKAAQEAKVKEEQELALAEWRKRKAEEKELNKLAREAEDKEEARPEAASSTSTSTAIERSEVEPVKVFKSSTLDGLKNHAIFLAGFKYSENPESPLNTLSETLGFLFNFHRYNLSRRIILAHTEQSNTAVELRTLLVHLTNKVDVTPNIISETQQRLSRFIYRDVVKLIQKRSKYTVSPDTDEKIKEIRDLTPLNQLKYSPVTTLPLYQSLYESRDQIDIERKIPAGDLYSWMKNTIVPLLNTLRLDINANLDAIKWVIIILGEHCDQEERLELRHNIAEIEPDKSIDRGKIDKFMSKCREIRNDLAHEISAVSDIKIENFLNRAALITKKLLEPNLVLDSSTLRPMVSEERSTRMKLQ